MKCDTGIYKRGEVEVEQFWNTRTQTPPASTLSEDEAVEIMTKAAFEVANPFAPDAVSEMRAAYRALSAATAKED